MVLIIYFSGMSKFSLVLHSTKVLNLIYLQRVPKIIAFRSIIVFQAFLRHIVKIGDVII